MCTPKLKVPSPLSFTEIASSKSLESSPSIVIIKSSLKSLRVLISSSKTTSLIFSVAFTTSLGNSSGSPAFLIIDNSSA